MTEEESWITLLLLIYDLQQKGIDIFKVNNDYYKNIKEEEEYQHNCNHIEWEQDMNAQIPFCNIDGEMCNMQCRRKVGIQ